HRSKHAIVAQTAVRRHVKCTNTLMRAYFSTCLLFNAPLIPSGDSHVQRAFVRGEGNTIGILGLGGGVSQGAIRGNAVDTAEVELTLLWGEASGWVGEVDAAVRPGHNVVGPVDALPAQALSQWSVRAIRLPACNLAIIPLADENPPL